MKKELVRKSAKAFDYADLKVDESTASALEKHAIAIDNCQATEAMSVLEMGKEFQAAFDRLGDHHRGGYTAWVSRRCCVQPRTAPNYRLVFKEFGM